MELFDTHAHLDDEQLQGQLDAVIQRARESCVSTLLTVGTTRASSETSVQIAHQFPGIFAAVGIQPNYGTQSPPEDWERVVELARDPRVRAIGETGLDMYWDFTPFDVQQQLFDAHLRLAQETGLPVVVHMRECGTAMVEMLEAAHVRGPLCGVMHSFTGTADVAHHCLALGLYISFSGIVTFKKSEELREIARAIPADRIVIETDAPYLAPHPHRGKKPNEPALLIHTAQCLADIRGVPLEAFAESTTANARRLFAVAY
ncbi:MAG: TatD family hydrolase [Pirellulaceae bacterium]